MSGHGGQLAREMENETAVPETVTRSYELLFRPVLSSHHQQFSFIDRYQWELYPTGWCSTVPAGALPYQLGLPYRVEFYQTGWAQLYQLQLYPGGWVSTAPAGGRGCPAGAQALSWGSAQPSGALYYQLGLYPTGCGPTLPEGDLPYRRSSTLPDGAHQVSRGSALLAGVLPGRLELYLTSWGRGHPAGARALSWSSTQPAGSLNCQLEFCSSRASSALTAGAPHCWREHHAIKGGSTLPAEALHYQEACLGRLHSMGHSELRFARNLAHQGRQVGGLTDRPAQG